jgi:fucose permease
MLTQDQQNPADEVNYRSDMFKLTRIYWSCAGVGHFVGELLLPQLNIFPLCCFCAFARSLLRKCMS